MIRFAINMNFRRRIPLYVTVVFLKESRSTRISLNVVRSTQIFNEILYKNSYFISKRCRIKMSILIINLIIFWMIRVEFPTMDSYYVTVVSGRKSWGTISYIKYFDCVDIVFCPGLISCFRFRVRVFLSKFSLMSVFGVFS